MYLNQSQEDILNALREKMNSQELSSTEQYFELKKHSLPVGPALYRDLEDILNRYK